MKPILSLLFLFLTMTGFSKATLDRKYFGRELHRDLDIPIGLVGSDATSNELTLEYLKQ